MAFELPDLKPWKDRLNAECASLGYVGMVMNYSAARSAGSAVPRRAYVMPFSDRFEPNSVGAGAVRQLGRIQVQVLLAVRTEKSAEELDDEACQDELREARNEVGTALVGWSPDSINIVEFNGGQLIGFEDFTVWWTDIYVIDHQLRV